MTSRRLHSRLNGFPRPRLTVECQVLEYLLPVAVLPAMLALSVVILPHSLLQLPHRCLFQVHRHSTSLLQHCEVRIGARQSLEQHAARKPFDQRVVHLMVDQYFGHVDLTRFLEVVILVGRLIVIGVLVDPSDFADMEETRM